MIYRKISFCTFLLLLTATLTAQACSGNLGENIFEDGDFGSGEANIVAVDPRIAPGFVYQRNPPPNDGFYTITNDMRRWANTFGTWDAFPDNSSDPNGYMMIVNAAFEPGKFYEQEVTGLCENTEYQFSADVRNVILTGENQLLPNVSFEIDGVTQFTTGFIAENQQWNTYAFTFNTAPGQTSVVLSLSNNAPGGFGNDLALDNISFRACGPEARIAGAETLRLCEDGDPGTLLTVIDGDQYDAPAYQWQQSFDDGQSWVTLDGENDEDFVHTNLASGFYDYRYLLANGSENLGNSKCRVVSNRKTVYVVPKRWDVTDTICEGLAFTVGSATYDRSGTYVDTLVSSLGCDSIVTLQLTVTPDPGLVADFNTVDPSCSYTSDGSLQLRSVAGAALPVELILFDTVQNPANVFVNLPEGAYPYSVTDRFGCATEDTLTLSSPNPFSVDLGGDLTVELGETARPIVGATDSIAALSWSPPGTVDCPAPCDRLSLTPTNSFLLEVEATSRAGCLAEDSIQITVIKNYDVYVATAFSPDGDGVNDRFLVQGRIPTIVAVEQLIVFDRWGAQVFEATDLLPNDFSAGWDGRTPAGEDYPAGAYAYSARVRFLDGEVRAFGGVVNLVR